MDRPRQPDEESPLPAESAPPELGEHEMECPVCGHPMPDLRGGKGTICTVCGFKDSCCF